MNRVSEKCAVLPRKTRATSLWRHKITSKYYEVGQENWLFIFIEMRPLPAYLRENFKMFLPWGFRIKFFISRYCKYKEWASYFSTFMGNELGWGSDKSSENRFAVHGICHVPHPSSFSHERRKKDTHSLNASDRICWSMLPSTNNFHIELECILDSYFQACMLHLSLVVVVILEVFKNITFSNAVWLQNCCAKFDVTLLFQLLSLRKYKFSNTNKSYDQ